MGDFVITSSVLNNGYTYKDDVIIVIGAYNIDNNTGMLQNINGSAYNLNEHGEQGDYIGNFSGYMRDGEIRYSLSEMSRRDSNKVWDAIDNIETHILPQEQPQNEE